MLLGECAAGGEQSAIQYCLIAVILRIRQQDKGKIHSEWVDTSHGHGRAVPPCARRQEGSRQLSRLLYRRDEMKGELLLLLLASGLGPALGVALGEPLVPDSIFYQQDPATGDMYVLCRQGVELAGQLVGTADASSPVECGQACRDNAECDIFNYLECANVQVRPLSKPGGCAASTVTRAPSPPGGLKCRLRSTCLRLPLRSLVHATNASCMR